MSLRVAVLKVGRTMIIDQSRERRYSWQPCKEMPHQTPLLHKNTLDTSQPQAKQKKMTGTEGREGWGS